MKKLNKLFVSFVVFFALFAIFTIKTNAATVSDITFDADYYASVYDDVRNANGYDYDKLREHFEVFGIQEGRAGSALFDSKYYLAQYPDLVNAFGKDGYEEAYNHFLTFGISEGRRGSRFFDVKFYLSKNSDLQSAFGKDGYEEAYNHYLSFGIKEGRDPSEMLDVSCYSKSYPDLVNAFKGDLKAYARHYFVSGYSEGRKAVHTPEEVGAVEATCTKKGVAAGHVCATCGETLDGFEVVNEKPHTYVEVEEKAATCTTDGMEAGYQCSVCEKYFDSDKKEVESLVVPSNGKHDFYKEGDEAPEGESIYVAVTRPDGEGNDVTGHTFKCKLCGAPDPDAAVVPHDDQVEIEAVPETCSTPGSTAGTKCSVCGVITKQPTEIDINPAKHVFGYEGVVYKDMGDGKHAAVCKYHADVTNTPEAHEYYTDGDEAEDKYVKFIDEDDEQKAKHALKCKKCDAYNKEEAEECSTTKETSLEAKAPGCLTPGYTLEESCSKCGRIVTESSPVEALGHDYSDPKFQYPSDKTVDIATTGVEAIRTCRRENCDAEEPVEIHLLATVTPAAEGSTDATCTTDGVKLYDVSVTLDDGRTFSEQYGVTIPKLGHKYVSIPEVPAKCNEDGHKACFQCSTCEKYFRLADEGEEQEANDDGYVEIEGELVEDEKLKLDKSTAKHVYEISTEWTEENQLKVTAVCSVCKTAASGSPLTVTDVTSKNTATCTEAGQITYTASYKWDESTGTLSTDGNGVKKTASKTVASEPLGHEFDNNTFVVKEDGTLVSKEMCTREQTTINISSLKEAFAYDTEEKHVTVEVPSNVSAYVFNEDVTIPEECKITIDGTTKFTINEDVTVTVNGTITGENSTLVQNGKIVKGESGAVPESWTKVVSAKLQVAQDEVSDPALIQDASDLTAGLADCEDINCLGDIVYDDTTNTVTFNITDAETAATELLLKFTGVGGETNIVAMFKTFAKGAKEARWYVGESGNFDSADSEHKQTIISGNDNWIVSTAGKLLLQMVKNKDSGTQKNLGTMTFADVAGETATARFYYTDEETGFDYYVDYTLVFSELPQ